MDRVLAVAADGGHLVELRMLLPRIAPGTSVDWVTPDSHQSRSLLAGERVRFVPVIGYRDLRTTSSVLPTAVRVLRSTRYRFALGSGAISLAFLPTAAALGTPAHFVESVTRLDGPSITGRLLGRVPRVTTYAQHPSWASNTWPYRGSVFDAYAAGERRRAVELRRIVVTLGLNPYPFRRLLERLAAILPPDAEVVWQTGHTDAGGLGIDARRTLPALELDEAMRAADVVVAHAGAGSALQALDNGKVPVLVPRRQALGEQTDDHQPPLAAELAGRGLAVATEVEDLTVDVLCDAAGRTALRRPDPPRFVLGTS